MGTREPPGDPQPRAGARLRCPSICAWHSGLRVPSEPPPAALQMLHGVTCPTAGPPPRPAGGRFYPGRHTGTFSPRPEGHTGPGAGVVASGVTGGNGGWLCCPGRPRQWFNSGERPLPANCRFAQCTTRPPGCGRQGRNGRGRRGGAGGWEIHLDAISLARVNKADRSACRQPGTG